MRLHRIYPRSRQRNFNPLPIVAGCGATFILLLFLGRESHLNKIVYERSESKETKKGDLISAYKVLPSKSEPNFLDITDPTVWLDTQNPKMVGIDEAHRSGHVHFGVWIFIVDSSQKVLLLKRGPELVTCPNSWGLLGEHASYKENPIDDWHSILHRAVKEEMGPNIFTQNDFVYREAALSKYPVYYIRDYGPVNDNRIDRQLTWLLLLQIENKDGPTEISPIIKFDDEVAANKWVDVYDIKKLDLDFCHSTINDLLTQGLDLLEKYLHSHRRG